MSAAYTEAWKPWDDRLADHVIAKRNWQLAFGAMALVALALAIAVVWLSSRIRYVVYAVQVDKLGYALAMPQPLVATTGPASEMIERMQRYEIAQYIREARAVSDDSNVEHQAVDDVFAHTIRQSAADQFLDSYYHEPEQNPFVRAQQQTVTVQIESILPLSQKTWQVRWQEEARDLHGAAVGIPTHWEAELQTEIVTPKDADRIITNPLGFYVTQVSWTEQGEQ
jgi:type IV secretion system protein VirB5